MPFNIPAVAASLATAANDMKAARATRAIGLAMAGAFFAGDFDLEAWSARNSQQIAQPDGTPAGLARFADASPPNAQHEAGSEPASYALIASDGSQILPDRHKPVLFGLIQAACVSIVYGPSDHVAPEGVAAAARVADRHVTRFYGEAELRDEAAASPAGRMMQERDLLEIEALADVAEAYAAAGMRPALLADGSIVPFALLNERQPKDDAERQAVRIAAALDRIRACGGMIAGYIDRPGSDAFVRAIAAGMPGATASVHGLLDRELLETTLATGLRTSCFDPGWRTHGIARLAFSGHPMLACYANLGVDAPYICRIEFPEWVLPDLGAIHAIVKHQALASIGDPYPFILRAAHDRAVLTRDDQRAIEAMLQREAHDLGLAATASAKQHAKGVL